MRLKNLEREKEQPDKRKLRYLVRGRQVHDSNIERWAKKSGFDFDSGPVPISVPGTCSLDFKPFLALDTVVTAFRHPRRLKLRNVLRGGPRERGEPQSPLAFCQQQYPEPKFRRSEPQYCLCRLD